MSVRVLSLPGWNGSGPEHWQSRWERLDARVTRIEQASWTEPSLEQWRARVVAELTEPTVLVGHSLGAALIAHVAETSAAAHVVGALLVAPPELSRPELPASVRAFEWPQRRLPFPSTLVASTDDTFGSFAHAAALASRLGATLVNAGPRGHLNADSGLGTWPEGWELLRQLRARAPFVLDPRLARDSHVFARSPLSELLLYDEARWPWLVLVPRRSGAEDPGHLPDADQQALAGESALLCAVLRERFQVDKVNVAALGNAVRQLHVHHIGRLLGDPAWPSPVWGHAARAPMTAEQRAGWIERVLSDPRVGARFVAA